MPTSCFLRAAARGLLAVSAVFLAGLSVNAQSDPLTPPPNSPRRADPNFHALVNATIRPRYDQPATRGTIVFRDGKVVSVLPATGDGPAPAAPAGATSWDGTGLFVFPGMVEPYLEVDAPLPDRDEAGVHWNVKVTPQRDVLSGKGVPAATAKSLRDMGFVAAAIAPKGGIFRGESATVSLAEPDRDISQARPPVYARRVNQVVAFEMAGGDGESGRWEGYPNSQMGCIALIRQTLSDADWQAARRAAGLETGAPSALDALAPRPFAALAGAATADPRQIPLLFDVADELEVIRAMKIAAEFSRPITILGSGLEFKRLDAITATGKPGMIVPLSFPKKPSPTSIGDAEGLDLRDLMTWEQAPTNPRRLKAAGLTVALTSSKTRERGKFMENLRTAIRHGLSEADALQMVTMVPATLSGVGDQLGSIEAGKRASFIVTDGPLFAKKTKIRDVWVDGQRHELNKAPIKLTGTWEVNLTPPPQTPGTILLSFDKDNNLTVYKLVGEGDTAEEKSTKAKNVRVEAGRISFTIEHEPLGMPGVFINSGTWEGKEMTGTGTRTDGARYTWTANKTGDEPHKPKKKDAKKDDAKGEAPKGEAPKGDEAKKDEAKAGDKPDPIAGTWSLTATGGPIPPPGLTFTLTITRGADGSLSGNTTSMMGEAAADNLTFDPASGALSYDTASPGGAVSIKATVTGDSLTGTASGGPMALTLSGTRTSQKAGGGEDDEEEPVKDVPENLPGYPFGAYAYESVPASEKIAITNATVWTSGPAGKIEQGAVVIADGKIQYVGPAAGLPRLGDGFRMIDAGGKHVTPGIIDCHSHTGISKGVNESGQAVTAEVRIGDVTNPDSMSWYWQLAGGITTVNNLHGSANPIGGQNQVNKNRWGSVKPDDLHFEGAIAGIKFALGENVKQSNWGDRANWRYPQTRMGVDTIIRDRFLAAREYAAAMKAWTDGGKKGPGPRRDLELECLAEILAKTRLIHCHSYRQDEILMLARLAQDFGFKIGSYQHILEGYKVAEAVRDFSYGGSAFSDWWAFKVEVQDAIPQAGPIMAEAGANVSFNSDSDELARRMHVEAGKARKYSRLQDGSYSLTEEQALQFVTLNPAKQLKIEDRVGSLEVGKDADVVIWNGHPLSVFSKAERTIIDGREYWSIEKDQALRAWNQKERQRLIQKLIGEPKKTKKGAEGEAKPGEAPKKEIVDTPSKPPRDEDELLASGGRLMSRMLDDARAYRRARGLEMMRRGMDPEAAVRGECGCGW